ncbi:MAG: histidinol-phosphate transaminase [Acidimicrobiia bacterium]|nr:histidinol-phosphate transaminase [Acidimicrobiia bacterium]
MSFPKYQWQPSTEEIARAAGLEPGQVERFDHNTSPFPTDWALDLVGRRSRNLNEYPDAGYATLREAIAQVTGLDPDQIAPGAGADELILLAARAFLAPGQKAVTVTPTYPLYEIATAQVHGKVVGIEASPPDFEFPADEVITAARDAEVVWLCAPSNPIGNRPGDDVIAAVMAATDGIVVLDAAYAEFAGDDWAPWANRHHNLLVLHTMSKAYGLAGARVGYALGHPGLIAEIDGVRPPGSIASLSVDLAIAALEMPDRMRNVVTSTTDERIRLAGLFEDLGLRVLPGATNFLLCEVGPQARRVAEALMEEGLVPRTYSEDGPLASYLRFTVRSPQADDRLVSALGRSLR